MTASNNKQQPLWNDAERTADSPVECLGMTFPNDDARRAYFLEQLRAGFDDLRANLAGVPFTTVDDAVARMQAVTRWPLGDAGRLRAMAEAMRNAEPAKDLLQRWKDIVGFPIGEDEDILRLSDPPYYTACPNPFVEAFVRHYGKPYDPDETYSREPFAVDVSEGKTDAIYTAHAYHTKVPYKAIVRAILHYTEPGDLVLDGFAGSGMTGVAAQICGHLDPEFQRTIEAEWQREGREPPRWGARRVVLNDLGPAATFISANYNLPFDVQSFEREARRILGELRDELGWMYQTRHSDGRVGTINFTVWSEVFACPNCASEITFLDEALDSETGRVRDSFPCPNCSANLNKDNLQRIFETSADPATGQLWRRIRFKPVNINYELAGQSYEKTPDADDIKALERIAALPIAQSLPVNRFPIEQMYHGSRIAPKGFTNIHHFYLPRAAQSLGALWSKAAAVADPRLRSMLLFFVEQAIWGMSILARYVPTHYSQVNQYLTGVYYIPSQIAECTPWYILDGKLRRLAKSFQTSYTTRRQALVATGTAAMLAAPDQSIDYIFTDPPFGENIYYADLNFLVESWHRVWTNAEPEAIVDRAKQKDLSDYQELMRRCFAEYYRVLKPGRWMTVVFHNSRNAVWNAIQEAMLAAGFVVADVRTLDKQQGSYRQVTSTAVKQDLVISAYRPNGGLEQRFQLVAGTKEGAWDFVRTHLRQLPVCVVSKGKLEVITERMGYMLYDRMVAFHVQRGYTVPMSASEFYAGLEQRFSRRDDGAGNVMYFLPEQVAEYDKKRMTVTEIAQLQLFVTDEPSAIQWLRQQLLRKPQTLQELQPQFMRESGGRQKYEKLLELSDLLAENFFCYDGRGPIPKQLVAWMRLSDPLRARIRAIEEQHGAIPDSGLETRDPALINAAKDRWYVPDPNRAQDLEKLRERSLLREFEEYRTSPERKLKVFRLEAVRAGFRRAWQSKSDEGYRTIVEVARKIPEEVLQEDPKLLMYYDQALTRMGAE